MPANKDLTTDELADLLLRQVLLRSVEMTRSTGCAPEQIKTAIAAIKEHGSKNGLAGSGDDEKSPKLPFIDDQGDLGE